MTTKLWAARDSGEVYSTGCDLSLFEEQPRLHPISGLWLVARDGMRRCHTIPRELLPELKAGECEEVEIVVKKTRLF